MAASNSFNTETCSPVEFLLGPKTKVVVKKAQNDSNYLQFQKWRTTGVGDGNTRAWKNRMALFRQGWLALASLDDKVKAALNEWTRTEETSWLCTDTQDADIPVPGTNFTLRVVEFLDTLYLNISGHTTTGATIGVNLTLDEWDCLLAHKTLIESALAAPPPKKAELLLTRYVIQSDQGPPEQGPWDIDPEECQAMGDKACINNTSDGKLMVLETKSLPIIDSHLRWVEEILFFLLRYNVRQAAAKNCYGCQVDSYGGELDSTHAEGCQLQFADCVTMYHRQVMEGTTSSEIAYLYSEVLKYLGLPQDPLAEFHATTVKRYKGADLSEELLSGKLFNPYLDHVYGKLYKKMNIDTI